MNLPLIGAAAEKAAALLKDRPDDYAAIEAASTEYYHALKAAAVKLSDEARLVWHHKIGFMAVALLRYCEGKLDERTTTAFFVAHKLPYGEATRRTIVRRAKHILLDDQLSNSLERES